MVPSNQSGVFPEEFDESAESMALMPISPITPEVLSPVTPMFSEDLAFVRTVVEAAGGGHEVAWAAAIVETESSRQLMVTADRGRWLPPGAVLPADVVLPWNHPDAQRWEGLRDPARVIIEYAAAVGGQVHAIATTYSTAPAVAAGVPWAFADGTDRPHPEMVGGAVVTRFELQVRQGHRAQVAAITSPVDQRAQALWVALDADARLGGVPGRSAMIKALAAHPDRLGDLRWVHNHDWAAVETVYEDLREQQRAAQEACRDVPVGDVHTGGAARGLVAQMCATEALLAVHNPDPERAVRDAVYAWTVATSIPRELKKSPLTPV